MAARDSLGGLRAKVLSAVVVCGRGRTWAAPMDMDAKPMLL